MGFKVGSYLTLWREGNNFGHNYLVRQCSTNRKDKDTGEYVTDFSHFVRFYGKAKDVINGLPERSRIKILDCDVSTYFNQKKGTNEVSFTVFDCERVESYGSKDANASAKASAPVAEKKQEQAAPVADDGLPF